MLRAGEPIPPLVVFYDGTNYWLGDGHCRVAAAIEVGLQSLEVAVWMGTQRRALEQAFRAYNLRSNAEKRQDVEEILRDPQRCHATNQNIARFAGVSHTLVGRLRAKLDASRTDCEIDRTRSVTRGDQSYDMDTSKIGRRAK
jgi:hypothetical protein